VDSSKSAIKEAPTVRESERAWVTFDLQDNTPKGARKFQLFDTPP
jgi:hypothetical protein